MRTIIAIALVIFIKSNVNATTIQEISSNYQFIVGYILCISQDILDIGKKLKDL